MGINNIEGLPTSNNREINLQADSLNLNLPRYRSHLPNLDLPLNFPLNFPQSRSPSIFLSPQSCSKSLKSPSPLNLAANPPDSKPQLATPSIHYPRSNKTLTTTARSCHWCPRFKICNLFLHNSTSAHQVRFSSIQPILEFISQRFLTLLSNWLI